MKDQPVIKKNSDLIWTIANLLRGPYRPPQYRRVMIPLTVFRRLDCVLENTKAAVLKYFKKLNAMDKYNNETMEKMINRKFKLHFHNTSGFTFANRLKESYVSLLDDPDNLAANLSKFIAGFSSNARKILEKFKFDEEIEKLDEANRLFEIIKEFSNVNLHPDHVPNMAMGYLFEDLVRRFNEQANEEAGDHFTPREVIRLMVHLLYTYDDIYEPGLVRTIYDPTCGTGGMLSVSEEYILDEKHNPDAHLELFGQEYNPEAYAICGSDLLIKGEEVSNIVFGDTLGTGRSKDDQVDGDGHPDENFHYMLANPPFGVEWKPEYDYVKREHEELGFSGRFGPGLPRINDGALLFLLHMISKMHLPPEKGGEGSRIAIVFNGSPLFTGDAGGGESNIRRWIIENDMLEAVVGLPDQLFYNTGIYTYIWIVSNRKKKIRKGKIQLIDATRFYVDMKKSLGNKRHEIGDGKDGKPNHIDYITKLYGKFKDKEKCRIATNGDKKNMTVSRIFDNREFGYLKITVERPLRLNFQVTEERVSKLIESNWFTKLAHSKKRKAGKAKNKEIEAGKQRQKQIIRVLEKMKSDFTNGKIIIDPDEFEKYLKNKFEKQSEPFDSDLKKVLLSTVALAERDPDAKICKDKKGNPKPDPELRDTENVMFPKNIRLPLPLEYETKKTKGKIDKTKLIELVQDHCEDYLKKEVLPYRPDAWIDHSKIKVGYEIPFTRHFYQYEPPRPLEDIEADIKALEADILKMLRGVTDG